MKGDISPLHSRWRTYVIPCFMGRINS